MEMDNTTSKYLISYMSSLRFSLLSLWSAVLLLLLCLLLLLLFFAAAAGAAAAIVEVIRLK